MNTPRRQHRPALAILNPDGGSGDQATTLAAHLEDRGCLVRMTEPDRDAQVLAEEAVQAGVELLLVAGGDGTVHGVVQALARHGQPPTLAVIPLGTGNDFARSLGVSRVPLEALASLDTAVPAAIDLLHVRGTRGESAWCCNHAAAGFSATVADTTQSDEKDRLGRLAYLKAGLRALRDAEPYPVTLAFDPNPGNPLSILAHTLVFCNGRTIAGGIPISPQAMLHDGLMEVVVIPQTTKPRLAIVASEILMGRHAESPHIVMRSCRAVAFQPAEGNTSRQSTPLPFSLDGEVIDWEVQQVAVQPGTIRVLVPREAHATWATPASVDR